MKIVVFSGAGISRESGLKTFRDSDGLWEGHSVNDVCTPWAWTKNPQLVLDFYNMRRREVLAAEPNAAHLALAELDKHFDVQIITQNIDDLHERAGSKNVLHLHGEILKARNQSDEDDIYDWTEDITMNSRGQDLSEPLRPHVVFFGEGVPNYQVAVDLSQDADVMICVGTTLEVSPANYIVKDTLAKWLYIVDPNPPTVNHYVSKVRYVREPASVGIPQVVQEIIEAHTPTVLMPEDRMDLPV